LGTSGFVLSEGFENLSLFTAFEKFDVERRFSILIILQIG
jgi:hypothetical protein